MWIYWLRLLKNASSPIYFYISLPVVFSLIVFCIGLYIFPDTNREYITKSPPSFFIILKAKSTEINQAAKTAGRIYVTRVSEDKFTILGDVFGRITTASSDIEWWLANDSPSGMFIGASPYDLALDAPFTTKFLWDEAGLELISYKPITLSATKTKSGIRNYTIEIPKGKNLSNMPSIVKTYKGYEFVNINSKNVIGFRAEIRCESCLRGLNSQGTLALASNMELEEAVFDDVINHEELDAAFERYNYSIPITGMSHANYLIGRWESSVIGETSRKDSRFSKIAVGLVGF